ncbi:hypothetical protein HD806DRAFT_425818 [Xylariaceae sp. AK1471]|nr:hypothetical protein HD806DRAFT_425818 [Xylariaceae sp. AK1471]
MPRTCPVWCARRLRRSLNQSLRRAMASERLRTRQMDKTLKRQRWRSLRLSRRILCLLSNGLPSLMMRQHRLDMLRALGARPYKLGWCSAPVAIFIFGMLPFGLHSNQQLMVEKARNFCTLKKLLGIRRTEDRRKHGNGAGRRC